MAICHWRSISDSLCCTLKPGCCPVAASNEPCMHALTLLLFVCSASMHLMHGCAAVVAFTCTFFGYLGCKTTVVPSWYCFKATQLSCFSGTETSITL